MIGSVYEREYWIVEYGVLFDCFVTISTSTSNALLSLKLFSIRYASLFVHILTN